jgi:hypothetical protein
MTCNKQAAFSAQSYSPVCRRFIHRIIARKKKTEPKNMKSFLIVTVPFPYVCEELPGYYTFIVRNCFYSTPGSKINHCF